MENVGRIPKRYRTLEDINKEPSIDERINNLFEIVFRINERNYKLEERIKSLEERVLQQSNSNTQNLIKIVKLDEYNEELLERIKSIEGGCKCKNNNSQELDKLRKENKKLKQTLKDLRLQMRLGNLYDKYERGEIDREQYDKYIEFLKYL